MTPRRLIGVVGEVTLLALTVSITIGLERLFSDTSFLGELLIMVIASHGLAIVARRAGFGMAVAALVSGAGALVVGHILLFPETASSIVPNGETLDLLRTDLSAAWTVFAEDAAPVEPLRGFVVACGAALWSFAFLADWAAFRLRSPLETVAPATAVFVFTSLLGADQNQVVHGVAYSAAVCGVLLAMRADRQTREEVWVAAGTGKGVSTTLRIGTLVGAMAVVFGALAGPAVPGAGDVLLDPTTWDDGPRARSVVSPLVKINASLVEQSNFEMFSVQVDDKDADRNYWRLMALTDFNGQIWERKSNFEDVRGPVESDVDESVSVRREVRQTITTRSLGGIYLPVAYEVSEVVDSADIELEYETATGSLVVTRESESAAAPGFTYTAVSRVPDFNPASLPADATEGLDSDFVVQHTALPPGCADDAESAVDCWPTQVADLADDLTADFSTDYEKVVNLQNYFLDPTEFRYDLDVAQRHNVNDIEDFLFEVQRGYCEQFASTFAAMARSVGIPARVAVGFTWGEWSETRQEYVVRGEHAHAWPEVYFAGVGWVVFDPTPGRAPAHGTAITGLDAAQLGENDSMNQTDDQVVAPPNTMAPIQPTEPDFGSFDNEVVPTTVAPAGSGSSNDSSFPIGVLLRAMFVLAVLASLVASVPLLRHLLRRRRLHRVAADPLGRAELAWDDAAGALALLEIAQAPAETLIEFTKRVRKHRATVGPLDTLATELSILRYAVSPDPISHALEAQRSAAEVVKSCRASRTLTQLFVDAIDPRTLKLH